MLVCMSVPASIVFHKNMFILNLIEDLCLRLTYLNCNITDSKWVWKTNSVMSLVIVTVSANGCAKSID